MEIILRTFASRYDLLSSRFFHIPGVLPYLLKCCPPERKDYIGGLALLPEEIALDCNIFDMAAVLASFVRRPEYINELNPKTAMLFTDEQLLTMVASLEGSMSFSRIFRFLYCFLRGKLSVAKLWSDRIGETVRDIEVDSVDVEAQHTQYFIRMEPILQLFPQPAENVSLRIKPVGDLLMVRPFLHYELHHSFTHFNSPDFPLVC
jgi:hypothetical protein